VKLHTYSLKVLFNSLVLKNINSEVHFDSRIKR